MSAQKDFEMRMQGMLYAEKIVKEQGLEALQKEIKKRGMTKFDIYANAAYIDQCLSEMAENCYANILTCFLYSLNESEGFGSVRIKRLKEEFDKNVKNAVDLDYLGEHYVKIVDYAKELNDKYNLGIDLTRLNGTQHYYDAADGKYHMARVERVVEMLRNKDFADAADYLQNQLIPEGK